MKSMCPRRLQLCFRVLDAAAQGGIKSVRLCKKKMGQCGGSEGKKCGSYRMLYTL